MVMNSNQSSKHDDPPKPLSAAAHAAPAGNTQKFVVLPHHPLYGCLVTILKRRVATTYVDCTIETPASPGFRYHIREGWLSSTPPPPLPTSPTDHEAVCLPLSALDKMVQRLLTTPFFRRIMDDAQADQALPPAEGVLGAASDYLGSTAPAEPHAAPAAPLLPGVHHSRRDLP